jgi:hypothetical protein
MAKAKASAALELPALDVAELEPGDPDDARSALADAEDIAGDGTAGEPPALEPPADPPAEPPPKKAPAEKKAAAGKPASLKGREFAGLKNDQLRTLLADRTNELGELRARALQEGPIASGAQQEELATAIGETLDTVASGCALAWGPECLLEPEQKDRLGRLWAVALRPYLGDMAKHAPMLAAVAATASVLGQKVLAVKVAEKLARAEVVEP